MLSTNTPLLMMPLYDGCGLLQTDNLGEVVGSTAGKADSWRETMGHGPRMGKTV